MPTESVLVVIVVIATFAVFSAALAWTAWWSKGGDAAPVKRRS